jgi:hypothetical protein
LVNELGADVNQTDNSGFTPLIIRRNQVHNYGEVPSQRVRC